MRGKLLTGLLSLSLILSLNGCDKISYTTKEPAESKAVINNNNETKENEKEEVKEQESSIDTEKKQDKKEEEDKREEDKKEEDTKNETKTKNEVVASNKSPENLDLKDRDWFFLPSDKGLQPKEPKDVLDLIKNKDTYYVGKADEKVLYLTFDEGYENGYTPKILDTLKENNVKVAFFVTEPYIKQNKELINRMVQEGHLVCNHTKTHPSMAKLAKTSKKDFENEILSTEKTFKQVTGEEMDKFLRPPMGAYNELSLNYTKEMGYKTVFWSLAYKDYDVDNQPSKEEAKNIIFKRTHNGAIILLHAISKTNTEILDELIKEWKAKGYEFRTLENL